MITVLQLAGGFVLLLFGAEFLVRGAVSVARRLKVAPMIIGMTIVAYGTTSPELVVSLQAAYDGLPGISVGNVVGSNICNILLILGTSALIFPIAVKPRASLPRCHDDDGRGAAVRGACLVRHHRAVAGRPDGRHSRGVHPLRLPAGADKGQGQRPRRCGRGAGGGVRGRAARTLAGAAFRRRRRGGGGNRSQAADRRSHGYGAVPRRGRGGHRPHHRRGGHLASGVRHRSGGGIQAPLRRRRRQHPGRRGSTIS